MLSESMRRDIEKMFSEAGMTATAISEALKVDKSTVLAIILDNHPDSVEHLLEGGYPRVVVNQVVGQYMKGVWPAKIAEALALKVDDVFIILAEEGVEVIPKQATKEIAKARLLEEAINLISPMINGERCREEGVSAHKASKILGADYERLKEELVRSGHADLIGKLPSKHRRIRWRE